MLTLAANGDAETQSGVAAHVCLAAGGKRFGVDLPFHDSSGATVGTMNVGCLLRVGEDTQPLLAHALSLRDGAGRQDLRRAECDQAHAGPS